MSWNLADDIGIVIGTVTGVIALVTFVLGVTRWVIRRLRRRAAPPVEPTTPPAVQPPPQLPPAPIVNVYPSQAPYEGGQVSTMPGPGSTTALTGFQTFGDAGAGNNAPEPASQPGINVSDSDAGHAEDLP